MSKMKLNELNIVAVMLVGDTVYKRQLNAHHLRAPIWTLFPHRNAGNRAFEAWARKKPVRNEPQ